MLRDRSHPTGVDRRHFLSVGASSAAVTMLAPNAQAQRNADARDARDPLDLTLSINGRDHRLSLDPRTTLLDAAREHLGLTGTKKGCDQGQCGACTLLVDGRRVLSCLTLAASVEGAAITTIEGLSQNGELHPMQQAFIDHDAFQCGYCTPGQIMSAVACVQEGHASDDAQIREYMSGNLCRCAAYPNIVGAVREAAAKMKDI
jgi:xanthine dehydrogenase YagT iron-sulfur-binding subunit